jgi:hypothetical protein
VVPRVIAEKLNFLPFRVYQVSISHRFPVAPIHFCLNVKKRDKASHGYGMNLAIQWLAAL